MTYEHVKRIKEKMKPWLKDDYLAPGDFCILCLSNVATYAICTDIDEDPSPGWYDAHFVVFDKIPPHKFGWKVRHENMIGGEQFMLNNVPVAIIPLEMSDVIPVYNGNDLADGGDSVIQEEKDPFGINGE